MLIDKFIDPDLNTFTLIAEVLSLLHSAGPISVDELLMRFNDRYPGSFSTYLYEALGVLFLTGKIIYRVETDTFEAHI